MYFTPQPLITAQICSIFSSYCLKRNIWVRYIYI